MAMDEYKTDMEIKKHLPDFMIIGAARCGTSSLHKNLLLHPRIQGPLRTKVHGNNKEVHFFDKKFKKGLEHYASCFPEKESKHILNFESTPNYLYDPDVPYRVTLSMSPSLKLIVILRDPVARAWSHFWHWKGKHHWDRKILSDPKHLVVDKGVYHKQLRKWFECFYRENFMVIKSEDFYANPAKIIDEVFGFLGVRRLIRIKPPVYYDPKREHILDPAQAGYEKIPEKIRAKLERFYRPHNLILEKLLKRKFGW